MFGGAMGFGCLVELWPLDVWWSYRPWMFGGAMCFGCLVGLWALDVWWCCVFWMFVTLSSSSSSSGFSKKNSYSLMMSV
jgi:hypothetical protein